jgi:hypothetical protein
MLLLLLLVVAVVVVVVVVVVMMMMMMMMMMVVVALGAVQSVYWYSPCQYPVPCFTAPKRYPLATCSG